MCHCAFPPHIRQEYLESAALLAVGMRFKPEALHAQLEALRYRYEGGVPSADAAGAAHRRAEQRGHWDVTDGQHGANLERGTFTSWVGADGATRFGVRLVHAPGGVLEVTLSSDAADGGLVESLRVTHPPAQIESISAEPMAPALERLLDGVLTGEGGASQGGAWGRSLGGSLAESLHPSLGGADSDASGESGHGEDTNVEHLEQLVLYPASHHAAEPQELNRTIAAIEAELVDRAAELRSLGLHHEASILELRVNNDLESLRDTSTCKGERSAPQLSTSARYHN